MKQNKTTKIDGMDPSTYKDVQGGKVIDVSAEVVEGNIVDDDINYEDSPYGVVVGSSGRIKEVQLTEEEKKLHDLQFLVASKGNTAPVNPLPVVTKKKSAKQRKEETSLNLADHADKVKVNKKINNLSLSLKNNYDQIQKLKKQRVVLEKQFKESIKAYKFLFGE